MIRCFSKKARTTLGERQGHLEGWFSTDAGQALLCNERTLLETELSTIFGYHAGQFSVSCQADLLATSPVRNQFMLSPVVLNNSPQPVLLADPLGWPVAPGNLDLVLLHHTLEIVDSPHRLLSEAANTIIPDGKLIIIGFNPYSIGSCSRWLVPGQRRAFTGAHFIAPSRLRDWLTLLNFSIERVVYGGYLHPLRQCMRGLRGDILEHRLEQFQWPFGGFYMMLATRQTPGLTPVRRVWSDVRRRFVGQPLSRPSAGRYGRDRQ